MMLNAMSGVTSTGSGMVPSGASHAAKPANGVTGAGRGRSPSAARLSASRKIGAAVGHHRHERVGGRRRCERGDRDPGAECAHEQRDVFGACSGGDRDRATGADAIALEARGDAVDRGVELAVRQPPVAIDDRQSVGRGGCMKADQVGEAPERRVQHGHEVDHHR
jgi:hypothetical protein